jgi:PAS domain S-box-containing protein
MAKGENHCAEASHSILDGAIEGVLIVEAASSRFTYANSALSGMLGYSREELLARTLVDIIPSDQLDRLKRAIGSAAHGSVGSATAIACLRNDGTRFYADINVLNTAIDGDESHILYFNDMTDKQSALDESRESHKLFMSVFNAVPDVLGIQGEKYTVIQYNEAGYRFLDTDADSVRGKKCYEIIGRAEPCTECATSETYRTKRPARIEKYVEEMDVWLDVRSYPIFDENGDIKGVVEHLRDITQQKRTEAELLKSEKLESIGILAGGIAHDFNNLLGGIYGYIDMARSATNMAEIKQYLDATMKTIGRARSLTQQLLTFSKGGAPARKTARIEQFLRETVEFASSGSNVSSSFDIPEDLWMCDYDANQMGQVVDNIVINALQAMPAGGTIAVAAENVVVKRGVHHPLTPGRYVKITIRDQGIGIPRELIAKIFDPFFTTKQKGSGLGLATSYSIVKQHGGTIEAESTPGRGSAFHIYLPATDGESLPNGAIGGAPARGTGRILVIDDEDVISNTVGAMLTHHGYTPVLARDGREALDILEEHERGGSSCIAVILDLTISGGMGGKETIREIRKRYPDMPVFVASGYAEDPIIADPRKYGFTDSIRKPFTRAALIEMLHRHI